MFCGNRPEKGDADDQLAGRLRGNAIYWFQYFQPFSGSATKDFGFQVVLKVIPEFKAPEEKPEKPEEKGEELPQPKPQDKEKPGPEENDKAKSAPTGD